ncbi:GerAB/ArcD/ProY family transporter [Bacillus sp. 165]|uniref:GerAB/ArcD/ProY family transporter n=1 Tax=Bacillus sp. 165 TaxID=1529117 RepID=UPI001ADB93D2|nr:GerAB/ArcD/ProY family transporter [Bacillus sp. 165]MBO9130546.1 GerAB/ArcD/ProY family transporter [Bacillus sp. 165]
MKHPKISIELHQLFFIILQSQIGIGVLALPYNVHNIAQGDGWISTMLSGVVVVVFTTIIWLLYRRTPKLNFFEAVIYIYGRFIGKIVVSTYIIFFVMVFLLVIAMYVDIIRRWILAYTPSWILVLLIIFTSAYLAKESLHIIARFYVLATLFIFLLLILMIGPYADINLEYILPVGHMGWKNIMRGVHESTIAMLGFEFVFIAFADTAGKTSQKLKVAIGANIFVAVLYTFFVFTGLIVFSPEELTLVPEPILYMLKAISFDIIERLDLLFLSVWVIPMITSSITYLFILSMGVKVVFNRTHHGNIVRLMAVILLITILCMPLDNFMPWAQLSKIIAYLSYIFVGCIPAITLLFSFLFKKAKNTGGSVS